MQRTHLSAALITRLIGLYIILQGVQILLTRARGENVGIYKLGIFIPVTDLHILLYGSGFVAAGAILTFLIPQVLPKLSGSVVKGILTLVFCSFGLLLGTAGVGLFFTSDYAVQVEMFGMIKLTSMRDLLFGGSAFLLIGLLVFAILPTVLYGTRAGQVRSGRLLTGLLTSALYICAMSGLFLYLSGSHELMSAARDLPKPQPGVSGTASSAETNKNAHKEGTLLDSQLKKDGKSGIYSGDIDADIPSEIRDKWEDAKRNPAITTVFEYNGDWYVYPKKGYLVDTIEVNGQEGTIILVKAFAAKADGFFPAIAYGYDMKSLKYKIKE
ncbi:hypothetical protein [Paenibacillus hamazuiensis]|uniref:hypothetical protein n=1 Tax=Paenibacillus hamazuiensis TaxID=2936508 RepID=UPI00200DDA33|nr:hypothetical protein [Paenibacillus hamazuiensis]